MLESRLRVVKEAAAPVAAGWDSQPYHKQARLCGKWFFPSLSAMSRTADKTGECRRFVIVCVCLMLGTLLLYSSAINHDFVNYDDGDYVTGNAHVQAGLSWEGIKWAFTTGHASNWHPLTWISHELDCTLFGAKPLGPHLVNVLLHSINTLLLFLVMRRMTGKLWPSAFVAALFAWHPVHVESVAWISERKDVLSTFFWLLTMLSYARYVEESKVRLTPGPNGFPSPPPVSFPTRDERFALRGPIRLERVAPSPRSNVWYAFALVCFICGLMSKPMLVTLPFVLLLLDFWPLGRIYDLRLTIDESKREKHLHLSGVSFKRASIEKVPFLVLAIGSSAVTFLAQRKGGAVASVDNLTIIQRLSNAVVSYLRYVGKMLCPTDLSVMYPHPGNWPMWLIAVAAVFLLGLSALAIANLRARPYLAVGWFWYVGTLVPVIGLVQVGIQSMADRYLYVPSIGLSTIVAWGVGDFVTARPKLQTVVANMAGVTLLVCFFLTYEQIGYWANSETLFRHTVSATGNNYLAHNNLGFYLENQGKLDEAIEQYRKSIAIKPNYEEAQQNLGHALEIKGLHQEAFDHLIAALSIKPGLVEAHNNLGNVLDAMGRPEEAIHEYREALRYRPDDPDGNNNLGIALAKQQKYSEAEEYLRKAVILKPMDGPKHCNLANLLALENKFDESITEYNRALELDPNDPQAHFNLGNTLLGRQRLDEAAAQFKLALKLRPENPEANYMLGLVAYRQGKGSEALGYFREALRLRPNFPEAQQMINSLSGGK